MSITRRIKTLKQAVGIILLSRLFLATFSLQAQNRDTINSVNDTVVKSRKNIVSVELGGNGVIYFVNYSRQLTKDLIVRIGFEPFIGVWKEFLFPVELYLSPTIGPNPNNHIEYGLGVTPYHQVEYCTWTAIFFARIGYAFHKPKSHWVYRIGYTPFFSPEISDNGIQPFGGISVGYYF